MCDALSYDMYCVNITWVDGRGRGLRGRVLDIYLLETSPM